MPVPVSAPYYTQLFSASESRNRRSVRPRSADHCRGVEITDPGVCEQRRQEASGPRRRPVRSAAVRSVLLYRVAVLLPALAGVVQPGYRFVGSSRTRSSLDPTAAGPRPSAAAAGVRPQASALDSPSATAGCADPHAARSTGSWCSPHGRRPRRDPGPSGTVRGRRGAGRPTTSSAMPAHREGARDRSDDEPGPW